MKRNIFDRGLISFYGRHTWDSAAEIDFVSQIENRPDLHEEAVKLQHLVPLQLDTELKISNPVSHIVIDHHTKTFLSVTNETLFRSGTIFYSEKTFKPVLAGQPFIICGNVGSINQLKLMGFKTFSPWIDERYDYEENIDRKVKMIIDELYKFSQMSIDQLKSIRAEMEPILRHNQKLFIDIRAEERKSTAVYRYIADLWNSF